MLIACVEELLSFVKCSFILIVLIRCEAGCFFLLFIAGVLFACLMIDLFVLVSCCLFRFALFRRVYCDFDLCFVICWCFLLYVYFV